MGASQLEQDYAQTSGVVIRHWLAPDRLLLSGDRVSSVQFEYTCLDDDGKLKGTGERCELDADIVFKAIGQNVLWGAMGDTADSLELERGRIGVDDNRKTSLPDVWAGGDCIAGGEDLTVCAVQDGKLAAIDIDRFLRRQNGLKMVPGSSKWQI